jgi:DNA-binding protein HU-beta
LSGPFGANIFSLFHHLFRFQSDNLIFAPLNFKGLGQFGTDKPTSKMTKADIVTRIAEQTGMEKQDVQNTVEAFMTTVRESVENGENVYLRGFGSFVVKTRAAKTGRNIKAKKSIQIPAHNIPSFKPAKEFVDHVKSKVPVQG